MRIGLISDTHIPSAGRELWPQVYDAFRGVDLIMHAGDLYIPAVLDWLAEVAPVVAVSGNGDYVGWKNGKEVLDPRLPETQVLEIEGLRIGLIHSLEPESPPYGTWERTMEHYFGDPPDVIVVGDTHVEEIRTHEGVLLVNPGSPTLPHNRQPRLGTVGFLEIERGRARPSILQLS
jgi:hypothetical protein